MKHKSRADLRAKIARCFLNSDEPLRTIDVNRMLGMKTEASRSRVSSLMGDLRQNGALKVLEDGRKEDYLHVIGNRDLLVGYSEVTSAAVLAEPAKAKVLVMPRSVAEWMARHALRGNSVPAFDQIADELQSAYAMGVRDAKEGA